jgi:hypothetical protein
MENWNNFVNEDRDQFKYYVVRHDSAPNLTATFKSEEDANAYAAKNGGIVSTSYHDTASKDLDNFYIDDDYKGFDRILRYMEQFAKEGDKHMFASMQDSTYGYKTPQAAARAFFKIIDKRSKPDPSRVVSRFRDSENEQIRKYEYDGDKTVTLAKITSPNKRSTRLG